MREPLAATRTGPSALRGTGGTCEGRGTSPAPSQTERAPRGRGASPALPSLPACPRAAPSPAPALTGKSRSAAAAAAGRLRCGARPAIGAGGARGGSPRGWRCPLSRWLRAAPDLASSPPLLPLPPARRRGASPGAAGVSQGKPPGGREGGSRAGEPSPPSAPDASGMEAAGA